jgi:integrase
VRQSRTIAAVRSAWAPCRHRLQRPRHEPDRRPVADAETPQAARPDRAGALSRTEVEPLLTREDISLRERTFWRMLYETAARTAKVLALNVEDLDLPNRRARVRRKGGTIDLIIWQAGTARLLPRVLRAVRPARYSSPNAGLGSSCPRPTLTPPAGPARPPPGRA